MWNVDVATDSDTRYKADSGLRPCRCNNSYGTTYDTFTMASIAANTCTTVHPSTFVLINNNCSVVYRIIS